MEHVSATASTLSPNVRDAAREALPTMVGAGRIHWHDEALRAHASDETEDLAFMPDVVMEPESTAEVSSILAWANTHGVPVTAAGARTGLSGGALPVHGGIALSMRRMNRIWSIDVLNHQAVVEPGVITEELSNAAAEHGLMYAVDRLLEAPARLGATSPRTVEDRVP